MEAGQVLGLVCAGAGIAVAAFSLPLYLRKVPPNQLYGARWTSAFESEERWYATNRTAGAVGLVVGLLYALISTAAIAWPPRTAVGLNALSFSPVAMVLIWFLLSWGLSRKRT